MANYNNAYATRTESTPRYSRNSKMDLEARRRAKESNRGASNYTYSAPKMAERSVVAKSNQYARTTATSAYGYGNQAVTGVRKGDTGINSRKATSMSKQGNYGRTYADGNTMRYTSEQPSRNLAPARNPQAKRATNKKRKANNSGVISFKYSMFLASVTLVVAGMSMSFLNVQANVNTKASLITTLQKNIADLSVENDSAYGAISQNMNMESVKDRAEEIGMEYANSSQVVEYDAPMEDTVKQYEAIPTSGVLAQSERTSE